MHRDYINDEAFLLRFWAKINKTQNCWLWTSATYPSGYGHITYQKRCLRATRVMYELAYKIYPGKLFVCHHCDNPICVNPEHLFLGTPKDNVADMFKKGRQHKRHGEHSPGSKLTDKKVLEVIKLTKKGMTQLEIANQFNIRQSNISAILNGNRWTHITGLTKSVGKANGEGHPMSKLTAEKVLKIRELYKTGNYTHVELGKKFGMSMGHTKRITQGRCWKHLL